MANHYFKIKSDDYLLPLQWWENYTIRFLRELPRREQLGMVDLISRFSLVYCCLGELQLDTQWLASQEEMHQLKVAFPRGDKKGASGDREEDIL